MEWKEVRLGDLCTRVCSGGTPKSTNPSFYDGGIPWLNTKEINFNRIYETERTISQEGLNNSSAKWIEANSVIIAMYGATAAKTAIAKVPITTNQACCNLAIDAQKADYEFIYYYLSNQYVTLASLANGGAQQNLNAQIIKDFEINLPSLATQRRISSILSSLDRKIELNNKINATLEEMAQALFKSWFVDFEPFKNGNFIDTEIGKIPEGWRVGTLGEIVDFKNGFAFKSSSFSPNGQYKLVTIKAVQDGKLVTDGADKIESLPAKMPAHCLLKNGDILLSLTGNVGRVCIVTEDDLLLNQRVAAIEPKDSISKLYTYLLFRRKKTQNELIGISRGTAQANLSPIEAAKLQHVIPSVDALQRFNQALGTAFEKFIKLSQETLTLTHLRDTLLPRLMSGEIEL